MGKFGIGARVRDDGGDEGVIVERAKGQRLIKYDDIDYGNLWQPKARLTVLPANDNICAETSENAYSGSGGEAVSAWVPKVGDRVRMSKPTIAGGFTVTPGTVRGKNTFAGDSFLVEFDGDVGFGHNGNGIADVTLTSGRGWFCDADELEPAPLTIEAGKFYRTRDGRKVGPMVRDEEDNTAWPWDGALVGEGHTPCFTEDGRWWSENEDNPLDLVAEWVEPVPEVAVAEATATPWSGQGKPGLVVRCDEWGGELFTPGRVYTFDVNGEVAANDGSKFEGIWAGKFSIVEPAAPPSKFKVGDRVRITQPTRNAFGDVIATIPVGRVVTISHEMDGLFNSKEEGWTGWGTKETSYWVRSDDIELASDEIPTGATVTFTATGRLSAYTEDGHAMIVFPGLTPGQNSFALPAAFVALAN